MSRLINADRLKEVVHRNTVGDLFDQFIDMQPTVQAITIDKIKQAREEIASSLNGLDPWIYEEKVAKFYIERDLRILDKLIESEE